MTLSTIADILGAIALGAVGGVLYTIVRHLWWLWRLRRFARRNVLPTASGAHLDAIAENLFGLRRKVESDEELRARCVSILANMGRGR